MNATHEEWRPVVGFEGCYEVSNLGRVRSVSRRIRSKDDSYRRIPGVMLRQGNHQFGYKMVKLCIRGKKGNQHVHQLVLTAFRGPRPAGTVSCHNDGNPANNHLSNLRWDTQSSNLLDKRRHGTDHEANKTHCPKRHEYTPENTHLYRGRRNCRQCQTDRTQRRAAERIAARNAPPCGE